LGGFHATLNSREALRHADAVVIGHAYGAWERVCQDLKKGELKQIYRGEKKPRAPVHLPRHLLAKDKYLTVSSTFATMGCTNKCRFCSINTFHRGERFERPIADVVAEVARLPDELFIFVDDNLTQNRTYALRLFRELVPLKRRWVIQASINIAEDIELLRAMKEGGCIGVFIGLETFSAEALREQEKTFNMPTHYRKAVRTIHRHGIYVQAGVIVGFDSDGRGVFQETLKMLEWVGIDAIQLAMLTPLPGTALYENMKDRIADDNWEHYDYRHAVFTPHKMSREELQGGADWLIQSYYKRWRIFRRFLRWISIPGGWRRFVYPLGLNLAYLGRVHRFRIQGFDPGRQTKQPILKWLPVQSSHYQAVQGGLPNMR
jgi:radical SAM superfamily enzyme YgiQ (UPF0313 family)